MADVTDRTVFAERIRLQVSARYRDVQVAVEPSRFAIRLTGDGLAVTVPLTPLHNDCISYPDRVPALIAAWVAGVEKQLTATTSAGFALSGLLWCVRNRAYLADLGRSADLATHEVGGDLVGFVSETLPGSIMRGVPRDEWEQRNISEDEVRKAADANTAQRFAKVTQRLQHVESIPRDGWRISGDALFQASILMVPDLLQAFVTAAGGDVVLGVPDRTLVLAIPESADTLRSFRHRVTQSYREAMAPCSPDLLITDGTTTRPFDERPSARSASLRGGWMEWLRD